MSSPPPLASLEVRRNWLRCCNGITREFMGATRVDLALEAQVARNLSAPAVVGAGQVVSYRDLDDQANRLAHLLRTRGAQSGDLIGIQLERSSALPMAVLAVLKAGCTYVPRDPTYPAERLTDMRVAAHTAFTIIDGPDQDERTIVLANAQLEDFSLTAPPVGPHQVDALIDVIFTSASTGQPKGAGVVHRGFTTLMRWFIDDFGGTVAALIFLAGFGLLIRLRI